METLWNIYTSGDSDRLRSEIFDLLEDSLLTIISRQDRAAAFAVSLQEMSRGVYLLLAFLFVFFMVNLINTLMTNLLARQQELGIMQSVGVGGVLGWVFDYVLSSFHIFGELSYQFPLMETAAFILALLIVTGMFSAAAVHYSKRLSLVERIKTME